MWNILYNYGGELMIRFRVFKLSRFLYYLLIIFLILIICFFLYRLAVGKPVNINKKDLNLSHEYHKPETLAGIIQNGIPVFASSNGSKVNLFEKFFSNFKVSNYTNPKLILQNQLPFMEKKINKNEYTNDNLQKGEAVEVISNKKNSDKQENKINEDNKTEIMIKDESEYKMSEEIQIQISEIENEELSPVVLTGEGPQILIYHTHSREAYKNDPNNSYKMVEAFRCDDLNQTVVKVGDILTDYLVEMGFNVLHDRTEHEQNDFYNSYSRSLETIKSRKSEYDTLKIFLDIHRNAYKEGVKTEDDEVVKIDGERVAKVFAVIGTGEGSMGGFKIKPNWKENYKFAKQITDELRNIHPKLAKDIFVRNGRYNQHVSTNAVLFEIGSNLTTLEEAKRTAKYLAEAISQVVTN